ncbi:2947_t:CDS:1 [Paraglomus brasilianum]|uniref:2947_t:CDS:1 n=1 Tax=Paraglomus brasilianum TaxID=144538 RepID=A0A9N9C1B8_9GLOM|nr:2947_t:CDS:1 [Paraglomus brasilianum]
MSFHMFAMWEKEVETFFEQVPQTSCLNSPLKHAPPKLKRDPAFHKKRRSSISDDSAIGNFWNSIEPVMLPKSGLSRRVSFLEFRQPAHLDFFWEQYGDILVTPYQNVTRPRRTGPLRIVKFRSSPEIRYYRKDEAPIRIGEYHGWDVKALLMAAWIVLWAVILEQLLYKR